ncbi:MAG: imidazolonepropionase [Acidobacteria bacterium]|nr:MAG: imidazolonepropionase [Acidobacteriota bacterium]
MTDPRPARAEADLLVTGISELVTCAGRGPARGAEQGAAAVVPRGAVAARRGRIVWVGPERDLPASVTALPGATRLDVGGRAVLPGLVDPHTHLVWAGNRADEFEQRLAGATYSEIAARGGGILRTVAATRRADEATLLELALARLDRLAARGATTIEVKSGYGLSTEAELKILRVVREAARRRPYRVVPTFLGAHTFPLEARRSEASRRRYVEEVCEEMLPAVVDEGLARFADVFVDEHAFSLDEAAKVLGRARQLGLAVKVHADQLADDGAARLAADHEAASADHLEHASTEGLRALAAAGTIAVLIPGASLFLRMNRYARAREMIDLGVPVALATDLNPGTCPCESLPLVMQLGCLLCGLTVDEAIVAATRNAAAAAGVGGEAGTIEPGKRCDLLVLDAEHRRDLLYALGSARIHAVVAAGQVVAGRTPEETGGGDPVRA